MFRVSLLRHWQSSTRFGAAQPPRGRAPAGARRLARCLRPGGGTMWRAPRCVAEMGGTNMADQRQAVVGVFRDRAEASNAIEALKDAGFPVDDISILMPDDRPAQAGDDTSNTDFGAAGPAVAGGVLGGAAGWLVGIGSFLIPGVGPFIGAGALITSLVGAAIGASVGALANGLVQM